MRTKWLKIILYVIGAFFCLSAIALFFPASWMKATAEFFLDEQTVAEYWPAGAVFDYLLRASLIAYVWIGATLLLAASDPARYKALVDLAMAGLFLFGVVLLAAGMANGLPVFWYLGDSLFSLLSAGLILALRPQGSPGS